jgi:hypothetical protein
VSARDTAKALNALIKKLPKGDAEAPPPDRSPIEELVYSFLLWESSAQRADNAFKRCLANFVDLNDLRVSRPAEVHLALGKTYPRLEERTDRLQASLHEIYLREHEVSLDNAASMNKRDARKYLESLEGMVPFVAARVMLFNLGAHAVPLEQRLADKLADAEALDDADDLAKAQSILERQIKADDAIPSYLKLQSFSESAAKAAKPKTRSTKAASKKRSAKKTRSIKASSSTKKPTKRSSRT